MSSDVGNVGSDVGCTRAQPCVTLRARIRTSYIFFRHEGGTIRTKNEIPDGSAASKTCSHGRRGAVGRRLRNRRRVPSRRSYAYAQGVASRLAAAAARKPTCVAGNLDGANSTHGLDAQDRRPPRELAGASPRVARRLLVSPEDFLCIASQNKLYWQ